MRFDEKGQSTLELALCLPIVVLLVVAIVQVGIIVVDQTRVWHAAREAVRVAAVDDDLDNIKDAASHAGLEPLDLKVTPAPFLRRRGEPVSVSVSYRPPSAIGLIASVVSRVQLTSEATMSIEEP